MANAEHMEVVQEGAKAVAAWRKKNPGVPLDLAEADLNAIDLAQADLAGADFHLAELDGARLGGANLAGANLNSANLNGANLNAANLTGADLAGADLKEADLGLANLSGADLDDADLTQANLNLANLTGAGLAGAVLQGADLTKVILREADLRVAVLEGARLRDADLSDADLFGADLSEADLAEADLWGARLDKAVVADADLTGARCGGTSFGALDLGAAKGLDAVRHLAPSSIGADTLYLSGGRLPKAFLAGCGVPDDLINYLTSKARTLAATSLEACFVSNSPKDQEFAERLAGRLRAEGLRVWQAPDTAQHWKTPEQTEQAVRLFDKWVLVLSRNNLKSDWVINEVRKAHEAEGEGRRKLFLVRLVEFEVVKRWFETEKDLGMQVAEEEVPDFTNWKDAGAFKGAMAHLLGELRAAEGGEEEGEGEEEG